VPRWGDLLGVIESSNHRNTEQHRGPRRLRGGFVPGARHAGAMGSIRTNACLLGLRMSIGLGWDAWWRTGFVSSVLPDPWGAVVAAVVPHNDKMVRWLRFVASSSDRRDAPIAFFTPSDERAMHRLRSCRLCEAVAPALSRVNGCWCRDGWVRHGAFVGQMASIWYGPVASGSDFALAGMT
jgi:hypothetical protein